MADKDDRNETVRLALDTCAVRSHIHQDAVRPDIEGLARHKGQVFVSISDVAAAELVVALLEERIPWDAWRGLIQQLDGVLDPDLPILPGGRQLAEMAGLSAGEATAIEDAKEHGRAYWRLLVTATCADDLKRGTTYKDSRGTQLIKADLALAQKVVANERQGWIEFIQKMKEMVAQGGWSLAKVKKIVLAGLQPNEGEPSNFADKLDALGHFLTGRIYQAAQTKEPYDPTSKKRKNDGIDLSLLYALAFPAIICTTDEWFINRVRESASTQASQVITIAELNGHLAQGTLASVLPRLGSVEGRKG